MRRPGPVLVRMVTGLLFAALALAHARRGDSTLLTVALWACCGLVLVPTVDESVLPWRRTVWVAAYAGTAVIAQLCVLWVRAGGHPLPVGRQVATALLVPVPLVLLGLWERRCARTAQPPEQAS